MIKGLGPGGAERLLVSLAQVRSADVDVEVAYLLARKSHLAEDLIGTGSTVHLLADRLGIGDPRWPVRLLSLVRRTRPDVVHLHSPAVAAVTRLLLRSLPGRPAIVSTEHNVWSAFAFGTRVANAATLALSDARLAVSEEVRSSAWRRHRGRIDVIVQGIPLEQLRARTPERDAARAQLGVAAGDVLIATVANLKEKKDYPTLLAAADACADDPRLRFVAIGQGPLDARLHELHRQLGLQDRFRFLGYHPDPPSIVAGADLFALTSIQEGLPIALLEAMALGVVPVVTAVGGIPEIVTHGVDGVLLPPRDPTRFAEVLRQLADDPARRRSIGQAAARRAGDFDIRQSQHALEALYRGLVERPK